MGSKVLPQALIITPRNPREFPPKKLVCSTCISRRPSSSGSSRVSWSSNGWNLSPIISAPAKRSFVVRAESNPEAEEEADAEAEVVENVDETEAEVKSEVAKLPWKARVKLGDVMGILNKRAVEASEKQRPVPDIRTGDIVELKLEVPENRRRLSVYKGIVISRQNAGIHTTFRIRRIIAGVGVEIVFPLYSPNIKEIKVIKHRKVRRARLYYLRDKLPRLSTFK
ncbi:large ribosomal subunit protein bL19cy-like [Alnus glutinosa]|uniref:large ribosomal subunit protein bL19cy-like n=1 Tax=Alnus glutinosa TaxID=3517 RepID=UPI002D7990E7|nr:large ribosomal subunit protein bL19cy-like [Alnus glutinosa]